MKSPNIIMLKLKTIVRCTLFSLFLSSAVLYPLSQAYSEKIYFAGYKGGFYIRSEEEGGMDMRLGGAVQADHRYYQEEERASNGFDIRKARLVFRGTLTRWFRFGMEFEFQGNETDNLVDAYIEGVNGLQALRFGQFKEPFSLEWLTADKAQVFAEKSMAASLCPGRDVGLMLHGRLLSDRIIYAAGLFNGDGDDGSTGGNEEDNPEITGRIVAAPFKNSASDVISGFYVGGSASYSKIDTLNIHLKVKSSGMAAGDLNVYDLSHNTKFGVIQNVDSRVRAGVETAWSYGPVGLAGELIHMKYSDMKPVGEPASDADFSAWYASLIWNITGEPVLFTHGELQAVYPQTFFNPDENMWGAFTLGARVEHFEGDKDWINEASHVSVREADAFSLSLNWVPFPMCKAVLDYTHTRLSDPIRVRVLDDGHIDYLDKENVVTSRFMIDF